MLLHPLQWLSNVFFYHRRRRFSFIMITTSDLWDKCNLGRDVGVGVSGNRHCDWPMAATTVAVTAAAAAAVVERMKFGKKYRN